MPLFPYLCAACERESELLVRGDEQPGCPHCGSMQLQRGLSRFAPVGAPASAEPMACGMPHCCRMQGGGCGN